MTADKKTGSKWLTIIGFLWAALSPICLGLGLFFIAFYDSPIDPRAGIGFVDYTLIGSVLSFPIVCIISGLAIWFLNKRSRGAATFAAMLPIIPLIPIIAIFAWSNSSAKEDPGDAIQLSECTAPVFDGGDGLETTGCGFLQKGIQGSGDLSTASEAHNWQFTTEGQIRITVRNDGSSCPHVMVLDSNGAVADGFEDENDLRLCPSGMNTTGFFEFRPPASGSYIIRYMAKNYPDLNSPFYSGKYALESPDPAETMIVVTYNIYFAENIDQAILDLAEIDSQKNLDILLLQEMDEIGVEQIARELQLNYVYYPAAIEPTYDKNFGNAILSRWPIIDSRKLILPHKSLSNRMSRIATRATIRIHDEEILVYSLHTESIFSIPRFREDQYRAILNDVDTDAKFVIIGGDFNAFTNVDAKKVEEIYQQAGFTGATDEIGNTLFRFGIGAPSDHIFTKGFVVEGTGTLSEASASDHLPIWVTLIMK